MCQNQLKASWSKEQVLSLASDRGNLKKKAFWEFFWSFILHFSSMTQCNVWKCDPRLCVFQRFSEEGRGPRCTERCFSPHEESDFGTIYFGKQVKALSRESHHHLAWQQSSIWWACRLLSEPRLAQSRRAVVDTIKGSRRTPSDSVHDWIYQENNGA